MKVWDLRKLKNIRSLPPPGAGGSGPVASIEFDNSGLYLAAGGGDTVAIYSSKADWALTVEFGGLKGVKAVRFGPDAKTIAVGTSDHQLRIYSTL